MLMEKGERMNEQGSVLFLISSKIPEQTEQQGRNEGES
jgi:hypothetical protein